MVSILVHLLSQQFNHLDRLRVQIDAGEYAVGVYNSVPIAGDGEGGFVSITVADGTDDEGVQFLVKYKKL